MLVALEKGVSDLEGIALHIWGGQGWTDQFSKGKSLESKFNVLSFKTFLLLEGICMCRPLVEVLL